ncbi:hypothetical protein [Psychromarinibacter halotolerans]|uniref:Uncharacterized protein n=2 Tax=Psychromarinibacter halotolerans TaxID=1775175 RepID=A0ABV7GPE1_9RHOB|nr:hypothetical protein [Psychromarinibacter halotolerans]
MSLAMLLGMMLLGLSLDAFSNDDEAPAEDDPEVVGGDSGDTPVMDVAKLVDAPEADDPEGPETLDAFDPASDVIVVELPVGMTDPDVSVTDDNGTSVVSLDGAEIARVQSVNGPLTADAVRIVEAG